MRLRWSRAVAAPWEGGRLPTSLFEAVPLILKLLQLEEPRSILDVGVGFGKYGVLAREALEIPLDRYDRAQWQVQIEGVEAFPAYRTPIHDYIYDRVYYADIRNIVSDLPVYDVILLIDVLEHFEKDQGHTILRELLKRTRKSLIVSTPLYPAVQGAYLGNPHEAHLSRWSLLDFVEFDFTYHFVETGANGAQVFRIFPHNSLVGGDFPENDLSAPLQAHETPLTVGYVLPHNRLTGGLKMLLEQMKHLQRRGHRVRAFRRDRPGQRVLPEWSDVKPDEAILVPEGRRYRDYVAGCDVVVTGWMTDATELSYAPVPVMYWEQGNEWLFGEMGDERTALEIRRRLVQCYSQPFYLAAVSPLVSRILYARYGRRAPVIPNGVDTSFYEPGPPACGDEILLVGNPALKFKGFDVALRTLQKVWDAGYRFRVTWVCQAPTRASGVSFPIELKVNPSQEGLPQIYRRAAVFLFTSWYEGFGMPPLEAMAAGVPVVTTLCGGVSAYVKAGYNALAADPGDVDSLASAVMYLLEDESARQMLGQRGRETALRYASPHVVVRLESLLRAMVSRQEESFRAGYSVRHC